MLKKKQLNGKKFLINNIEILDSFVFLNLLNKEENSLINILIENFLIEEQNSFPIFLMLD